MRPGSVGLALRHMRIRVDDPQLVDELVHHLQRSGCVAGVPDAAAVGDGVTVDVEVPAALDEEQARLELGVYLMVFEATHPATAATLL